LWAWGSVPIDCLAPAVFPSGCSKMARPWLRFSIGGYVGFLFPRLTWLLVAPGRPLTFPRRFRFLPFVSNNYSMSSSYIQAFFSVS
ncbi:MAG: hypothetical protein QNJ55_36005, partial [Xenococcus sp. MO_188.B8]|nr:hypothetical protein [Xenococcus sp. MO_188.B8]